MGLLRIPRQDGFVLVRIDPLDHKDVATLNVKILATEGSVPFVLNLKQNQVQKLKSKKAPCTDEEWEAILKVILLQQESDPDKSAAVEGIEVEAIVEEDVAVEIIFKKSTSGITQRLGTIRLLQDEDQEIELFEWCGSSIQHTHSLDTLLKAARQDLSAEQTKSQKLFDEIQELLKAKTDDEKELLEKFSRLLNAKKAKIRDQQRALKRANIDTDNLVTSTRPGEEVASPAANSDKSGPSRRGKRKADTAEPEEMDIDEEEVKDNEEEEVTRDTSDAETTENDDVENDAPVSAKKAVDDTADVMDEDGSATESEDDGL